MEFAVFQIAEAVAPLVGEIGVSGVVFQQIDFAAVELEGVDFAFGDVDGFELIGCGRVMQQLFPVQEVERAVRIEPEVVRNLVCGEDGLCAAVRLPRQNADTARFVGFLIVAEGEVDDTVGFDGKASLYVVAHLTGHDRMDAVVVPDALPGKQQAGDNDGNLRARGRALGVEFAAIFAGKDARGVHQPDRAAKFLVHGGKVRNGAVVDGRQRLRGQNVCKQSCQLLPGDGSGGNSGALRAGGWQKLCLCGVGNIRFVPCAIRSGDFHAGTGGVNSSGDGNCLRPGNCLGRGKGFCAGAGHDAAAVDRLYASFIPAACRNIGKCCRVVRCTLKSVQLACGKRGNGQGNAQKQRNDHKRCSAHEECLLLSHGPAFCRCFYQMVGISDRIYLYDTPDLVNCKDKEKEETGS